MLHVKCDTWHVTHEAWHMTCVRWWTLCQNCRSLALMVWEVWCFECLEEKDCWLNYKSVCITAQAKPSSSKTQNFLTKLKIKWLLLGTTLTHHSIYVYIGKFNIGDGGGVGGGCSRTVEKSKQLHRWCVCLVACYYICLMLLLARMMMVVVVVVVVIVMVVVVV